MSDVTCYDPIAEQRARECVIGIDPSLTGLAVCVYRRDGTHALRTITSKAAKGLVPRFDRYQELVNGVFRIIDPEYPSAVLLEGYGSSARGHSQIPMIEFGAMLRRMLIRQCDNGWQDLAPIEVAPASLKKFAAGKGNADKLAVCLALSKRYSVSFQTNDEFDAYALARIASCVAGWEEPQTDKQREVVALLRGEKKVKAG